MQPPSTLAQAPVHLDQGAMEEELRLPQSFSDTSSESPVRLDGRNFLRIGNVDHMPPFLMSVVSASDFWLFVGSNGGFTAGRVDPDHAIFPYQTADRILRQPNASGVLTLFRIGEMMWEPWVATCPPRSIIRNLYKHITGTSVIFEEIHEDLELVFRAELSVSERFGLVRRCHLENTGSNARTIELLDGWNHLLPSGVTQETYSRYSYLAAAYMRHECVSGHGLGIYTLNSGITDRAEPCECLRASCAWSLGLDGAKLLLSDRQVDAFRRNRAIVTEREIRGAFGAHLLVAEIALQPGNSHDWILAADTGLDHAALGELGERLREPERFRAEITADLTAGVAALRKRIAGAGANQQTADANVGIHHFANVLFNCMRGGTLDNNYRFPVHDFRHFLQCRNLHLLRKHEAGLATLPDPCSLQQLANHGDAQGDPQFSRLAGEYLPICFSRRHGDPSRPWNRFEIHTKEAGGNPIFAYAGNWRDIFQNWESLAYSYPLCFGPMIDIFLNASTADGYNPYRITRADIDWEVFDPADPWSHIGYWGDHQIVYLLRLLEGREKFQPGLITSQLNGRRHSYANVPYEIHGFDALLKDPKHTIDFNRELHVHLMERTREISGDGKLLTDSHGEIILVSLAEKLLLPLLVKLSNLVPGGGIWLNTQRPEWNDANNALAGWGLSVVTVCYLRRYVMFLDTLLSHEAPAEFELSEPVAILLASLTRILTLADCVDLDDSSRLHITEALGRAGETHRNSIYVMRDFVFTSVRVDAIRHFLATSLAAIDATLANNRRCDALFHSYNLLDAGGGKASVQRLDLMLEGQVAILSSGFLSSSESLRLMEAMRESPLYREDQSSYLLYPDRTITPFLERNVLPAGWEAETPRLAAIVTHGDRELIRVSGPDRAHFHPDLSNARDLSDRLDQLAADPSRKEAIEADRTSILELWERVFRHRSFTGRSGAMFGFEGLGSIYWHMVAKLLLAVQETHQRSVSADPESRETKMFAKIYEEVRNGLGFTKTSDIYGAFPSDPYSHSPRHQGAQQPGMTGQVKEEILTRMGELGVHIENGHVRFKPSLLQRREFFETPHAFSYYDVTGELRTWELGSGTLAFTLFQVPVCYILGDHSEIELALCDGQSLTIAGNVLPEKECHELYDRSGSIRSIVVHIPTTQS